MNRRTALGLAALVPLAGCAKSNSHPPTPTPTMFAADDHHGRLAELERKFDARLGVYALATGTGATIAYRADERFAFCSTFKGLVSAAVVHRNPPAHLNTVIRYSQDDLLAYSPITEQHVATGMTIRQLCDAAVRYSDNAAGNLLLREIGGPAQLTAYLRSLGDTVTRMDRTEPTLSQAVPGDLRDTSSPRALGTDYRIIVLDDALPGDKRAFLRDLLERNTTGAQRIRAAIPSGWTVADKTGSGDYGTANDIAIVWPPEGAPLVISVMSSKAAKDAPWSEALIAEAAAYVIAALPLQSS